MKNYKVHIILTKDIKLFTYLVLKISKNIIYMYIILNKNEL